MREIFIKYFAFFYFILVYNNSSLKNHFLSFFLGPSVLNKLFLLLFSYHLRTFNTLRVELCFYFLLYSIFVRSFRFLLWHLFERYAVLRVCYSCILLSWLSIQSKQGCLFYFLEGKSKWDVKYVWYGPSKASLQLLNFESNLHNFSQLEFIFYEN